MGEHDHPYQNTFAGIFGFAWHFVQMVIVMMLGMGIYHLLYALLDAPLGLSAALRPYPAVRQFMMDLAMAAPMVPFMWYIGSSWRRNVEMVAAMLAGPIVFLTCLQLGVNHYVPGLAAGSLQAMAEISMYLGMLAVMLYRRNDHAAHCKHHPGGLPAGRPI